MSTQAQSNLSPEVNAYLDSYKTAAKTRSAEAAKQTIVTLRLKPGAQPSDVASRIEALPGHRLRIEYVGHTEITEITESASGTGYA